VSDDLLEIKEGAKWYGNRLALRVDNVKIKKGDRIIVSGDNGCGKSTLLRVVAGMTSMDKGFVFRSVTWRELSIGYLPQEGGIYRDLTIAENQKVIQDLLGSRREVERGEEMAQRLGLSALLNERIDRLSGGFRRLAAIHSLLSSGASVLVLDEPFASLDLAKQAAVHDTLATAATDYLLMMITEHTQTSPQIANSSLWTQKLHLNRPSADVSSQT
jgi:ABC-type multidrug transport system ATPase subunit